jgi:hypothetical protein
MPGDPSAYRLLAALVRAFGRDGQPSIIPEKRRGRLVSAADRATAGLQGIKTVLAAVTTIVAIIIVWTLLVQHKIHLADFPHDVP